MNVIYSCLAAALVAGSGSAQTVWVHPGSGPNDMFGSNVKTVGDFDLDGVPDLIAHGTDPALSTVRPLSGRTGASLFTVAAVKGVGSPAGDIDADGRADLIVADIESETAYVVTGNGGAVLHQIPLAGLGEAAIPLGDIDGDGYGDFLLTAPYPVFSNGAIEARSGLTGAVLKQKSGGFDEMLGKTAVAMGDLDSDGFMDFAVGSGSYSGFVAVFSGFTFAEKYRLVSQPYFGSNLVGGSDLTGDGLADFCVAGTDIGATTYSGVDGAFVWQFNTNIQVPHIGMRAHSMGDLTGDGLAEVAVKTTYDLPGFQYIEVMFVLDGTNPVWDGGQFYMEPDFQTIAILGDLTGDGFNELAFGYGWHHPGQVRVDVNMTPGIGFWGEGTKGCSGQHYMAPHGTQNVGSTNFGFTSSSAPPLALGLVIIADAKSSGTPIPKLGVITYLDFAASTEIIAIDMISDRSGFGTASVFIPNDPALQGLTYHAQSFWYWGASCSPSTQGLTSSNRLDVTIQ